MLIYNSSDCSRFAMEATLTDLPPDQEKEIPELSVENPCVIENIFKENKEVIDLEKVELIYEPPRFFRRSLIYKTLKFFDKEKKEEELKFDRPLTQK